MESLCDVPAVREFLKHFSKSQWDQCLRAATVIGVNYATQRLGEEFSFKQLKLLEAKQNHRKGTTEALKRSSSVPYNQNNKKKPAKPAPCQRTIAKAAESTPRMHPAEPARVKRKTRTQCERVPVKVFRGVQLLKEKETAQSSSNPKPSVREKSLKYVDSKIKYFVRRDIASYRNSHRHRGQESSSKANDSAETRKPVNSNSYGYIRNPDEAGIKGTLSVAEGFLKNPLICQLSNSHNENTKKEPPTPGKKPEIRYHEYETGLLNKVDDLSVRSYSPLLSEESFR